MDKTGKSVLIIMSAIIIGIALLMYAKVRNGDVEFQTPVADINQQQASEPTDTTSPTTTKPSQPTKPMTTDGLQVTTITEGTGEPAKTGDTVSVHYTGMLTNGTVFDSNVDPKFGHPQPFSFTLGQNRVIAGWEQGVLGMKKGEKRHFVIPSNLGYGAAGAGALIPPNATLEFDVEVLDIMSK